jgi:hypothetical protein
LIVILLLFWYLGGVRGEGRGEMREEREGQRIGDWRGGRSVKVIKRESTFQNFITVSRPEGIRQALVGPNRVHGTLIGLRIQKNTRQLPAFQFLVHEFPAIFIRSLGGVVFQELTGILVTIFFGLFFNLIGIFRKFEISLASCVGKWWREKMGNRRWRKEEGGRRKKEGGRVKRDLLVDVYYALPCATLATTCTLEGKPI